VKNYTRYFQHFGNGIVSCSLQLQLIKLPGNSHVQFLDTYGLPPSINRSAMIAFWLVNSPYRGILETKEKTSMELL